MGAGCSSSNNQPCCLNLSRLSACSHLTQAESSLINENYKAMAKHSHEIGLMCYERIIERIPEAQSILEAVGTSPKNREALMGQGQIFIRGLERFVFAANEPNVMRQTAEGIVLTHSEKFDLSPGRLAHSLAAIEEIFIQEAMAHCQRDRQEETTLAWRKFFRYLIHMFQSISRR